MSFCLGAYSRGGLISKFWSFPDFGTSISGLSLPGFNPGRYAFTLQTSTWANSTQVEPGFTLGSIFCSVNRALE